MPTALLFISSLLRTTSSKVADQQYFNFITMIRSNFFPSMSTDSDVFCVERLSERDCQARNNTPLVVTSTQLSGALAREAITISSVASTEPLILMIKSDSNEPSIPYGFGNQHLIVPLRFNDLNLPPYPFNILATLAVIQPDKEYSRQSPEPSDPSPISAPQ